MHFLWYQAPTSGHYEAVAGPPMPLSALPLQLCCVHPMQSSCSYITRLAPLRMVMDTGSSSSGVSGTMLTIISLQWFHPCVISLQHPLKSKWRQLSDEDVCTPAEFTLQVRSRLLVIIFVLEFYQEKEPIGGYSYGALNLWRLGLNVRFYNDVK